MLLTTRSDNGLLGQDASLFREASYGTVTIAVSISWLSWMTTREFKLSEKPMMMLVIKEYLQWPPASMTNSGGPP